MLNTLAVDGAHSAAFDFPQSSQKWILCLVEALPKGEGLFESRVLGFRVLGVRV